MTKKKTRDKTQVWHLCDLYGQPVCGSVGVVRKTYDKDYVTCKRCVAKLNHKV